MKKILYFFLLFLGAMGLIGGVGYSIFSGAWPIAIGVGVLGWMAWPKFCEMFRWLSGGGDDDMAASAGC